ncbi:MAG: hypothetical protein JWN60_1036, partial [Acidobacteria bacterium]|nr:hypothetical protein [Acidobacteriota bacterium]
LNGDIVEGRETSKIRIKPESDGIKVTVTVKIIGLFNHCVNTASEFVNITPAIKDYFPDEYGKISLKDEFAILDTLIVRVANAPQYQGFIKISIDKNESVARTKKHIRQLIKYIEYRGFSKKRFVFVIRKTTFHTTVLDLIPKDSNFPNCENCEILRGEDL